MSVPLLLAVLWVLAATGVAMLPLRYQFAPGLVLLIVAPVLIGLLGQRHGWLLAGLALAACLSMYRVPLRHYLRRTRGGGHADERERSE